MTVCRQPAVPGRAARISPQEHDRYWRDGFLVLRERLGEAEIGELRAECRRLWNSLGQDRSSPRLQWRTRVGGGSVCDRIDPVLDISPRLSRLAADPRLTALAADLLGGEVNLFKAKLISKWPGTTGYALHQDYSYWSFVGDLPWDDFVSLIVPLDPFNAASGATEFFPGLHHRRLAPPSAGSLDVDESQVEAADGLVLDLAPGDLALFHGMTPHRSAPNRSAANRESIFLTYALARHGELSARYYTGRQPGWIDQS